MFEQTRFLCETSQKETKSMKKFILITASILAMSCSPISAQNGNAQSGAMSEAHHMQQAGKLYVSATGHAAQAPDRASVSAGVVSQAPTAGEAMRANARQMSSAFAALKKAGIKERNIQTSQMSLQPQYDYQNRKAPRITGYEVRNTITAKTYDLDNVGSMLDALVSSGVNNINGVTFSIKDPKAAKDKARTDAIVEARARAESMAKAAGIKLGKVFEIRENSNSAPRPTMYAARMMADSAESTTPISAGEQTLSVTVSITYLIDE
ncbi:MAG TPA: SIMPL domain-containing protein [Hellea balneolensis]|uniref:SIMPL domain-containing protein n=1 Tax=Hellea balneolensis TaxID=287478 RepID=A0A7C3C517_9PROT|nr:SIMPL domain-containing protein [Hellea balneolensis]